LLTLLAFAFAFALGPVLAPQTARAGVAAAALGRPAPAFVLETPSGGELTALTYAGHPLVMNVFASWCPPCRAELPRIVAAAARYRKRVQFVGIDEQEAVTMATSFTKHMKLPYPIALDNGQFAASYGAKSLPETIFVDASGVVRAIVHGAIAEPELERDLALIAPAGVVVPG
jgi:thiol-disulfide isomerase/thioredoxin